MPTDNKSLDQGATPKPIEPPTPRQVLALERMGLKPTQRLTKWQASVVIGKLLDRKPPEPRPAKEVSKEPEPTKERLSQEEITRRKRELARSSEPQKGLDKERSR